MAIVIDNSIVISKFPAGIYDAFIVLLADVGIPNPAEKIIFSDVPLRQ
jgi:hypothetical protein